MVIERWCWSLRATTVGHCLNFMRPGIVLNLTILFVYVPIHPEMDCITELIFSTEHFLNGAPIFIQQFEYWLVLLNAKKLGRNPN